MIRPLQAWVGELATRARGGGVTTLEEQAIGRLIPDLLVGIWRRDPRELIRRKFTVIETHILAHLERCGPTSPERVAEQLLIAHTDVARTLQRLTRLRVIRHRRNGTIELTGPARTAGLEIVAIEAKIRRWKRALAQAQSYQRFADESYVLVDGAQVRLTSAMEQAFRAAGVGLLLLSAGEVILGVPAARRRAYTPERVRATDRLYHAALTTRETSI
ncbi:MAG TPA: hypothetical protein VIL18_14270 [Longimicrobiales bacterium]